MKIRTFLGILATFAVAVMLIAAFDGNSDLLEQEFLLWGNRYLPLWSVVLLAFVAGVVLAMAIAIADRSRAALERYRRRRQERERLHLEEKYLEGVAALVEGRPDEALHRFTEVLDEHPQHLSALIRAGDIHRQRGRVEEAVELHRRAREIRPDDTRPLHALADDYETLGDLGRARKILSDLIEMRPKGAISAYRRLRGLEIREGNWEAALEAHRKVEALAEKHNVADPADQALGIGIRFQMGLAALQDGRARAATVIFRRLVREAEDFVPAWLRLGEALVEMGSEEEACEAWNRGFEATGSPTFLTALEDHFLARERPLDAIASLKRCISVARKDLLPRFYLGKLYFRLEMLDEAREILSELRGRASYAPTLHYLLGRIAERRGEFEDAAADLRESVRQSGVLKLEYRCGGCGAPSDKWLDRCTQCGSWNTVEVDFREAYTPEELGLSTAPVYTVRP